jgi:bifunctional UDP-N-acetylglucosamine pyrophosphorylase/glucosamine-1-phosphate N-acetyltransferase
MDDVAAEARRIAPEARIFVQQNQMGTADAVLAARPALMGHSGDVLVLYGDTPLIRPETLKGLSAKLDSGAGIVVLGFEAKDPTGYGRLLVDGDGHLTAIREEKDASTTERAVRLCNSGVLAFRCPDLLAMLESIGNANAKGEYYLTDVVAIGRERGHKAAVVVCPEDEVLGVNSRDQLATADGIFQARARLSAMTAGATLQAPDTVYFAHDTVLGQDVTVEPYVVFGPGVRVENGVDILAFSHIAGAHIATGARIGPYARVRPGSRIARDAHVGNFVELKATIMEEGAKANHLAYIGDSTIGQNANIGAGTIFCNYDGFFKHRTEIGPGAFVGSNSAIVAPVRVGAGAYIGSGSVVTQDVPADALAIERAELKFKLGWAERFRSKMRALKAKAK